MRLPIRIPLMVAVACLVSACQQTPCERMKDRAETCDNATSRYVEREASVCTAVQQELPARDFEEFAECVEDTTCDDAEALAACNQNVPGTAESPCLSFKLWAAACGLEPIGTEDECNGLSSGFTSSAFTTWVGCMTSRGCPTDADDRYEQCREELTPTVIDDTLRACGIISEWNENCDGAGIGPFLGEDRGMASCLAQAQTFTSASMMVYAECLEDLACDAQFEQLDCMLRLAFIDPTIHEQPCQLLFDYGTTCDINFGFESLDVCTRLFSRFSQTSVELYVDCIVSSPCDEVDITDCASHLELGQ